MANALPPENSKKTALEKKHNHRVDFFMIFLLLRLAFLSDAGAKSLFRDYRFRLSPTDPLGGWRLEMESTANGNGAASVNL